MAEAPSAILAQAVVEYDAAGRRIVDVAAFVAGSEAAERLGAQARLAGVSIGAEVRLTLVEVALGVAEGQLHLQMESAEEASRVGIALQRLVDGSPCRDEFALSDQEMLRLRVFVDLWKRGHFVALGSKFGVDYLVYRDHPSSCHSFAMVLVKELQTMFTTVDIVSHCRVAKMVRKELLLASQHDRCIVYLSLDHAVLTAAWPERRLL